MTTVIGVVAIVGMTARGDTAEMIVAEFSSSLALAVFVGAAGLVMSFAGGCTAATIADRAPIQHGAVAGVLATILNGLLIVALGDSGPWWLTATFTTLTLPCAALGAWMAAPICAQGVASQTDR